MHNPYATTTGKCSSDNNNRVLRSRGVTLANVSADEGPIDQSECDQSDEDLAKDADHNGSPALPGQVAKVGSQANSGECRKKRPTRKIAQAGKLRGIEEVRRSQHRDDQKAEDELRELLPE